MKTKRFHLSDILSVTTPYLVSDRHMDGVHEVVNHIMGRDLFTHELVYFRDEYWSEIKRQFPHLTEERLQAECDKMRAAIDAGESPEESVAQMVREVAEKHTGGELWFDVQQLPARDEVPPNPIETLLALKPDATVVVIAETE